MQILQLIHCVSRVSDNGNSFPYMQICDTLKCDVSHVGNIQFSLKYKSHAHLKWYVLTKTQTRRDIWLWRDEQFFEVQKQCKT